MCKLKICSLAHMQHHTLLVGTQLLLHRGFETSQNCRILCHLKAEVCSCLEVSPSVSLLIEGVIVVCRGCCVKRKLFLPTTLFVCWKLFRFMSYFHSHAQPSQSKQMTSSGGGVVVMQGWGWRWRKERDFSRAKGFSTNPNVIWK